LLSVAISAIVFFAERYSTIIYAFRTETFIKEYVVNILLIRTN